MSRIDSLKLAESHLVSAKGYLSGGVASTRDVDEALRYLRATISSEQWRLDHPYVPGDGSNPGLIPDGQHTSGRD